MSGEALLSEPSTNQRTLSVSQLNRKVKSLLETHFPLLWVEGEISNFSRPSSGHWYFTLKDTQAQVSCAMFKRRNATLNFTPKVGDQVLLRARVSLYEGRGDFQLIVEHMEAAGFGLLQRRFEELKATLHREGLFELSHKKALPAQVQHLAVVTSASGAAIRDVLTVLQRRFPAMNITIVPSLVQGDEAPQQLVSALAYADAHGDFDCILLCRGGGSIEDLWAFNDEALARQIYTCQTPVISAVGHEVDFTIADFVADIRAATPSAAAELLSPNQEELLARFEQQESRLLSTMLAQLQQRKQKIEFFAKRLKHPQDKLDQWQQRLDQLEIRLNKAIERKLSEGRFSFQRLEEKLSQASPDKRLDQHKQNLAELKRRLSSSAQYQIEQHKTRFARLLSALDIVSPMATLKRGYSITKDDQGQILRSVSEIKTGSTVTIMLSDGELKSKVLESQKKSD